jgi:membrane-bound inhibitor of C-type lysozyme
MKLSPRGEADLGQTRRAAFIVVVGAAPLLGAGCADLDRDILGDLGGGGGDRDRRTAEYRCDEDRRFEVAYRDDGDEAEVRTRGGRYRLKLEDRDGRRRTYGDGDVVLTVEGDEARLRVKDEPDYSDCEER